MRVVRRQWSVISFHVVLYAILSTISMSAEAQQPKKIPRIGYLASNTSYTEAFLQGAGPR